MPSKPVFSYGESISKVVTPRNKVDLAPPISIHSIGASPPASKNLNNPLILESMMSSDEKNQMKECVNHVRGQLKKVK